MFRSQFFKRSTLKAVCAVVLVSGLAIGGQAGAKPIMCERVTVREISWITIYGVNFPVLTIHYEYNCP